MLAWYGMEVWNNKLVRDTSKVEFTHAGSTYSSACPGHLWTFWCFALLPDIFNQSICLLHVRDKHVNNKQPAPMARFVRRSRAVGRKQRKS